MKTKIDELMVLADDYATYASTAGIERYLGSNRMFDLPHDARNALRTALEAALNNWKQLSMTELAAENSSAMEYCKHWEDRALKAEAALNPGVEPVAWNGLTDVQWMNIVNLNGAWYGFSVEDAVHEVVKLTEARLKANNTAAPPAQTPDALKPGEPMNSMEIDEAVTLNQFTWSRVHAAVSRLIAPTAQTLCYCKDRLVQECPGKWEPGCDLGNNDAHAVVVHTPPRLTDDTITIAYQMGSSHSEGLRNIETEVRKQFGYE
jgi:hypothetical protein